MWTILALLLAILFIVLATARWTIHPWLALVLAALGFGLAVGLDPVETVKAANQGFGATIGTIGGVVILGGVIGVFMERTGAALRLAEAVLKRTGERNIPAAMAATGYITSIAVFCDTAFVILSSLNRALSQRAGVSVAGGAVALALGLYATHTLVPPTPGPVAAAGVLGADLGLVVGLGLVVAALALIPAWAFAALVAAREPNADSGKLETLAAAAPLQEAPARPGVAHALMPIFAPLALIVAGSVAGMPGAPFGEGALKAALLFVGQPLIALLIGAGLACTLPRPFRLAMLSPDGWVGEAIKATALILIVTGAGGAFAAVLAKTDLGATLGATLSGASGGIGVLAPFAIAAMIKTAQGSSTVSMITTAGVTAPLLPALGLDSELGRALATLAVGAGAMVVSHANDSYFWVVAQFSGMTPRQAFRLHTLGTAIQGSAAGLIVWAASALLLPA